MRYKKGDLLKITPLPNGAFITLFLEDIKKPVKILKIKNSDQFTIRNTSDGTYWTIDDDDKLTIKKLNSKTTQLKHELIKSQSQTQ